MLYAFYKVYEEFLKKGVMGCARIIPGGDHSEASWERQVPIFMECLKMNNWDENDAVIENHEQDAPENIPCKEQDK